MENVDGGILLVDKQEGETSHDVVQSVRKALSTRKVGHAGTLDPFATGLLVLLVGRCTKLSAFITEEHKTYEALVRFGVETDTYDKTGKVTRETDPSAIKRQDLEQILSAFTGEIDQVPPPFSAVKVKGRRAYEMARKGKEVELPPRRVFVYELVLEEFEIPFARLRLRCSSGTYVRSLASDLGKLMGCGAHLSELRRTQIGSFHVEQAISSTAILKYSAEALRARLINPIQALAQMAEVEITKSMAEKVRKGYRPTANELGIKPLTSQKNKGFIKLVCDGQLVAVASTRGSSADKTNNVVTLKRVFS